MAESALPGSLIKNTEVDTTDALAVDVTVPRPSGRAFGKAAFRYLFLLLLFLLVWEGAKFVGGDPWNITAPDGTLLFHWEPPLQFDFAHDLNMPHLWDIFAAWVRPAQRNGPPLIFILAQTSLVTMQEALVGFILGSLLGITLGVIFAHSSLFERALVPYMVGSQTVPILAIAPMVVVWLRAGWWSVAILAAYLVFFPVAILTLRGLRSPDPRALELMKSYAASSWTTLWKVRFPAALPYIFTALKIAATTCIVGAIIGELPSGLGNGLGRVILNFNQSYSITPNKLWATIIFTAFVGMLFFASIVLVEKLMLRNTRKANG